MLRSLTVMCCQWQYSSGSGINLDIRFTDCLRCLSSIFSHCVSCLQRRAGPAYISQRDIRSPTQAHTHHPDLQKQAIGCALPHSQWHYSAHAHYSLCQRLSVCVFVPLCAAQFYRVIPESHTPGSQCRFYRKWSTPFVLNLIHRVTNGDMRVWKSMQEGTVMSTKGVKELKEKKGEGVDIGLWGSV